MTKPVPMPTKKKFFSTRNLTLIALLSAISALLFIFPHFHTFPAANYLVIEFSDLPVIFAAVYLHPAAALVVSLVKCLLHLPFSETAGLEDILSFLQGAVFCLPFFFFRARRVKGVKAAKLAVGTLLSAIIGMAVSFFILMPVTGTGGGAKALMTFALVLPFSIVKYGVLSIIVFTLFATLDKHLIKLFEGSIPPEQPLRDDETETPKK